METKLISLTKEEISEILTTATYCNGNLVEVARNCSDEEWNSLESDCFEDKLAELLIKGGTIKVYDNAQIEDCNTSREDCDTLGKKGINWIKKGTACYQGYYYRFYVISLQTLIDGINANKDSSYYLNKLFVEKCGDMFDAYNLLQIAVYGEEIYG